MSLEIEYPEKLLFLLDSPARYKILYGGRGAGKTENVARAADMDRSKRYDHSPKAKHGLAGLKTMWYILLMSILIFNEALFLWMIAR